METEAVAGTQSASDRGVDVQLGEHRTKACSTTVDTFAVEGDR
jgi:hypothetical protein